MRESNFPQTWLPSPENRDLRQLLWHRHRSVHMRTRIMNQLQALAMNEGKRWKSKLWSQQASRVRESNIGSVSHPAGDRPSHCI
jgi:transposase